jgi:hypothetical protein
MQLLSKQIPRNCTIHLAGDMHIGSLLTHWDGIHALKDAVLNDPQSRLIVMGDAIEAILVDDNKRFDPTTSDLTILTPGEQYDRFVETFQPVAKQILFMLTGNHEIKHLRIDDFARKGCEKLKVPYGTYSAKFTALDSKKQPRFKIYTTHGFGSIGSIAGTPRQRAAAMEVALTRKLMNKAADCILMAKGHTHKIIVARPISELYLTDNGEAIKQHYTVTQQNAQEIPVNLRWYVNTGSFMKNQILGASGYAERFGYDPVVLGWIKAIIEDHQLVDVQKVLV